MSAPLGLALVLTTLSLAVQPVGTGCEGALEPALAGARRDAERGDFDAAAEQLRVAVTSAPACVDLSVAAWSTRGWIAALAAGDRGGTAEALAEVTRAREVVGPLGPAVSAAAYAGALLQAAAAAAQDERDEMAVWIEHARDLSGRLATGTPAPRWPLPIDWAEGELWYQVDDFERAEAAFMRVLADGESPAAWRGLARARDRRGNRRGACEAYRRVLDRATDLGPALAAEARGYLRMCAP